MYLLSNIKIKSFFYLGEEIISNGNLDDRDEVCSYFKVKSNQIDVY